jgi:hypothetical protein
MEKSSKLVKSDSGLSPSPKPKSPKWKKLRKKKGAGDSGSESEGNPVQDPVPEEKIAEFRDHADAKPYLDNPKFNDVFISRYKTCDVTFAD